MLREFLIRTGRMLAMAFGVAAFSNAHAPAFAQAEGNAVERQQLTEEDAAALLLEAGRLDDAKRVLAHILEANPNNNAAIFMQAMIAVAGKDYDAAIERFRRILATEPNRERVRLELARAFFLARDYENSERNFRFARAGDLPPEVKTNIDQYLGAIVRLKRWSYDVGFALAEDTNVNGATSVHQVDLYGLPFTLSDNARQKSGMGVSIDVGGEWSPLLSDSIKARLGGHVHRLEYGGSAFDDMTTSVYAGPEFLFSRWQVDTLMTGFRRWYGNTPYNQGIGGRAAVRFAWIPELQLGAALDFQALSYRLATDQNGTVTAGSFEASYTVTPSSLLRVSGGIGVQTAKLAALADTISWFALDYYQDLAWGFSANIEPALAWTRYDAPLAAVGITREDHLWAIRLDLLNRRIEYGGFAPRLSLVYTDQASTVSLYRYSRAQIQIGLTRQF